MSEKQHIITFKPSGRGKAQCEPNPDYPYGVHLRCVIHQYAKTCTVDLPYPAPECGAWFIDCTKCGIGVGATTAGRVDDPIKITIECKDQGNTSFTIN